MPEPGPRSAPVNQGSHWEQQQLTKAPIGNTNGRHPVTGPVSTIPKIGDDMKDEQAPSAGSDEPDPDVPSEVLEPYSVEDEEQKPPSQKEPE